MRHRPGRGYVRDALAVGGRLDPDLHAGRGHVELLGHSRPMTRLRLPFSGHPTGEFLEEAGLV
jgi:hypothetical protein